MTCMAHPEQKIQLITEALKKYHPQRIILFGSRAKGTHRAQSDIDIAVDLKLSHREKRSINETLDQLAGLYSVDLIFLPEVKQSFRDKILQEGIVLYEKK